MDILKINKDMLKKLFGYDSAKTTIRTEIVAGVTTSLTMAYILAIYPDTFSKLDPEVLEK